jgi:prepilin signal peptidase PulO-like enzyme (type II secretory pathway)
MTVQNFMTIELLLILFTGLVFGSFITCASWRLPREEDIVKPPSYCPVCNTRLGFKDLWPVLSWATAKGKCRHCKAPVSVRYPLTEIATAAIFFLLYERFGITSQSIVLALLAVALLIMIVVDFEHTIIPDEIHYFLLPLGIFYHWIMKTDLGDVAGGVIVGLIIGPGLHYGYRWIRKKEGLGFGDVKFLAVAGLWLGLTAMPPFLFFSGVIGVALGLFWRMIGRGPRFPFGPALATALFLCLVYPEAVVWFWNLFRF